MVTVAFPKTITTFKFEAANNSSLTGDVVGTIDETNNTISATVPFLVESGSLIATFTTTGDSVEVDAVRQASATTVNDFNNPVIYTVTAVDGTTQDYTITVTEDTLTQQAYIKAVNNQAFIGVPGDLFGDSVSLYGNTLAVGASFESSNQTTITNGPTASADNSSLYSGAVYVYTRSGSNWTQEAYIKAANNGVDDRFGNPVSLFGETLAVSARLEDSNQTTITNGNDASADSSNVNSGAVYVYTRNGTTWTQQAYIKAVNNDIGDYFGVSISLSGDTLAVGAYNEDSNQTTITNGPTASADNSNAYSGAVYVYTRSGSNWSQQAYLKAVNNDALDADSFGSKVSLSGDTLAVAASSEDSNQTTITNGDTASSDISNSGSGAVYVYTRSGTNWT